MRNTLANFLVNKIDLDKAGQFVFLTGDLGFSVLEPLREKLGKRFINAGVAEALMASAAAGIARDGFKVYVYSITPFATFRCLEQIRNDIAYHNLDVTVVGVGAGYGYGALGPTHHALDDLAAMWSLPQMKIYSPGDLTEAKFCYEDCWVSTGPKYLRIGKGGEPGFKYSGRSLGGGIFEYRSGAKITLITTGSIASEVMEATADMDDVQILTLTVLKPFPETLLTSAVKSNRVLVIEELYPYGGFSGEVAKALISSKNMDHFRVMSAKDAFAKVVGNATKLRKDSGMSRESIRDTAQLMVTYI